MTTWLSAHFALEELSSTSHREIDNDPPPEAVAAQRVVGVAKPLDPLAGTEFGEQRFCIQPNI